jgi:outer membrane protein assembly factor BamA
MTLIRSISAFVLFGILIMAHPVSLSAQSGSSPQSGSRGRIDGDLSFLPLPYINYSRSLEFSFGLLPMAMFNPVPDDTLSPSSLAGLLGMYTTNKSWMAMGFSRLFFDRGNWRISMAGGSGSINFQFFADEPVNGFIPYNASMDFVYILVQRRIIGQLYGGMHYFYMFDNTGTELLPVSFTNRHSGLGVKFLLDSRSNVYYPREGFLANAGVTSFPEALGNAYPASKVSLDCNGYMSVADGRDVLAARVSLGFGIGDLSFNQQFIVGGTDIRGYSQGAFRGNGRIAAQAEYRFNFDARWGVVGFAGAATILDALNEGDSGILLPGVGGGLRFTAFTDNHMNVGLDAAMGKDDWGLYFRIGEAF